MQLGWLVKKISFIGMSVYSFVLLFIFQFPSFMASIIYEPHRHPLPPLFLSLTLSLTHAHLSKLTYLLSLIQTLTHSPTHTHVRIPTYTLTNLTHAFSSGDQSSSETWRHSFHWSQTSLLEFSWMETGWLMCMFSLHYF